MATFQRTLWAFEWHRRLLGTFLFCRTLTKNHENRILRVILGVEHESGIYFAMPCHLGKIMSTYNKKMQRGDQGHL